MRVAAGSLLIAQIITAIAAFGAEIVVARLLGPSGRGTYAVLYASLQVGTVVGAFALGYVAVREVHSKRVKFRSARSAALVGTIPPAVVVAVVTGAVLWNFYPSTQSAAVILALSLNVVMSAVVLNERQLLTGFASATDTGVSIVLERVGNLLLLVLCLRASATVAAAMFALVVSELVTAAVTTRRMFVRTHTLAGGDRYERGTWRLLAKPAAKLVAGNIAQFTNYRLDVFLLAAWKGPSEAGTYAVAVSLTTVLWYLSDAVGQAAYPVACAEIAACGYSETAVRAARLVFVATLGLGVLGAIIAPMGVPLLFGREFEPAVLPLVLLLPGVAAFSIPKVLGGLLVAAGQEARATVSLALASVITISADIVLIPEYGAEGAAVASSLAYVSATIVILFFMRRTFPAIRVLRLNLGFSLRRRS